MLPISASSAGTLWDDKSTLARDSTTVLSRLANSGGTGPVIRLLSVLLYLMYSVPASFRPMKWTAAHS